MQQIVKNHIEEILEREIVLEKPKDINFGHFATPVAFSMTAKW